MSEPQGTMWGVTAYFNPAGYATKLENLKIFATSARQQGLKLCIVELANRTSEYQVPDEWADRVLRVQGTSVLWQKERLINLGLAQLPSDCQYFAWLDCDIVFGEASWVERTAELLENHKIVQPFQMAVWLPQNAHKGGVERLDPTKLLTKQGVAYARQNSSHFDRVEYHPEIAHPGFAWVVRREVLDPDGIYDRFVLGGADFFVMLAMFFGSSLVAHPKVSRCLSQDQSNDFKMWAERFHRKVGGDVVSAPGTVFHLWHGDLDKRQYVDRYEILRQNHFNPKSDIVPGEDGCWEWGSAKADLHRRVSEYFASRLEDGSCASTSTQ